MIGEKKMKEITYRVEIKTRGLLYPVAVVTCDDCNGSAKMPYEHFFTYEKWHIENLIQDEGNTVRWILTTD